MAGKLVKLLELLAKKYQRISRQLAGNAPMKNSFTQSTVVVDLKQEAPAMPSVADSNNNNNRSLTNSSESGVARSNTQDNASFAPNSTTFANLTLTTSEDDSNTTNVSTDNNTPTSSIPSTPIPSAADDVREALRNEQRSYADFIHIILSLIRTTLTRYIAHNPHLIYTLLHVKSELFGTYPFSSALGNIQLDLRTSKGSILEIQADKELVDLPIDPRFVAPIRHIWQIVSVFDNELRKAPIPVEQQTVEVIMV